MTNFVRTTTLGYCRIMLIADGYLILLRTFIYENQYYSYHERILSLPIDAIPKCQRHKSEQGANKIDRICFTINTACQILTAALQHTTSNE